MSSNHKMLLKFCFLAAVTFVLYKTIAQSILPLEKSNKFTSIKYISSVNKMCPPNKNLSFIKIHRVGSGTFHNVLVRFAINHEAFIALANVPYYQVFPRKLTRRLLLPHPSHPNYTGYNMFIDHVIFDKKATDALLPKDVVYITQIREPFSQNLAYYKKMSSSKIPYSTFLLNPEKYESKIDADLSKTRNAMALELGYGKQKENNITDFRLYLQQLDKQLFHVSILEQLPQSYILLRRKMCWEIKDLLFLRIHVQHSGEPKENAAMVARMKAAHRQWSALDYTLYEFFLARHKEEVEKQDASFHQEVAHFIQMQKHFTQFCQGLCGALAPFAHHNASIIQSILYQSSTTFPSTAFHESFRVTYADCAMLYLAEIKVKKALKYHMNPNVCHQNPRLASILQLSCDTSKHTLPGLVVEDLKQILKETNC